MIDNAATMTAISLGLDSKQSRMSLRWRIKPGDGQDGKINEETLKTVLNKVLEDVPALKPQLGQATGLSRSEHLGDRTAATDDALKKAFDFKEREDLIYGSI